LVNLTPLFIEAKKMPDSLEIDIVGSVAKVMVGTGTAGLEALTGEVDNGRNRNRWTGGFNR
jgi:hypothetical protein